MALEAGTLQPGAAAFYGVTEATRPIWRAAIGERRTWYYLDNAYFDIVRGTHFRATKNALQVTALRRPDWKRFAALGLAIQPWRRGRHIVVCAQSDWYMRGLRGWPGGASAWLEDVLRTLKRHTERPIVVRHWNRDKELAARSLKLELQQAHALVTHTSAAANEALIAGVPVFVTGECAASPMASSDLAQIESPRYPDGRFDWAAGLAAQQWTVEELRSGAAWRALNA